MTTNSPRRSGAGQRGSFWTRCRQLCQQSKRLSEARLSAEQRQFLPVALEVQETPPSPAGRWLVWTLLALSMIGVLWAYFGKVDIVVTAPGRIVPSGHVKIVQAIDTGTVVAIHVRDDDRVRIGQALVSLDPTVADADNQRIERQLADLSLELTWRRGLDTWLANDDQPFEPLAFLETTLQADKDRARALYVQHITEIAAQLTSVERDRDATLAELAMARAESNRVQATLPILADRVAAYKALYDAQFGAKVTYLEMLQQRTELEKSVPVLKAREQQLTETLASLDARLSVTREEHRTKNLLQISSLESEKGALIQEEKKASQRQQQQILTAPVTGKVQQLAIHTIGGVVTQAQELMKIVPEHASIEVEALLQNRDIGFVNEGQPAEVKIDAFNFTKYGLIDAELVNISNDALEDQKLGWVFKLRLQLAQDNIAVDDKLVKLSPGMAVTAEIKTGKRRLIEFFLSPLLRYRQESVRER